jgi:hypothetical protein
LIEFVVKLNWLIYYSDIGNEIQQVLLWCVDFNQKVSVLQTVRFSWKPAFKIQTASGESSLQ